MEYMSIGERKMPVYVSQVRPQWQLIAELSIEPSDFIKSGELRARLSECYALWMELIAHFRSLISIIFPFLLPIFLPVSAMLSLLIYFTSSSAHFQTEIWAQECKTRSSWKN
jgi:hypothetical protein